MLLKEYRVLANCRLRGSDRHFVFVFIVVLPMYHKATTEDVRAAWERRFGTTWQMYQLIAWEEAR